MNPKPRMTSTQAFHVWQKSAEANELFVSSRGETPLPKLSKDPDSTGWNNSRAFSGFPPFPFLEPPKVAIVSMETTGELINL